MSSLIIFLNLQHVLRIVLTACLYPFLCPEICAVAGWRSILRKSSSMGCYRASVQVFTFCIVSSFVCLMLSCIGFQLCNSKCLGKHHVTMSRIPSSFPVQLGQISLRFTICVVEHAVDYEYYRTCLDLAGFVLRQVRRTWVVLYHVERNILSSTKL